MREKIIESCGNVFSDVGFPPEEAAILQMRADLMIDLRKLIKAKKLTQVKAAKLLGISQSRVSDLIRGKWERFSLEMLITLAAQGGHPRPPRDGGHRPLATEGARRMALDPTQFLGLPSPGLETPTHSLLPLPVEKTVCYGRGTAGGPRAIIAASCQIETFDEETLVEFAQRRGSIPCRRCRPRARSRTAWRRSRITSGRCREKFLLALGGEHSVTYGLVAAV